MQNSASNGVGLGFTVDLILLPPIKGKHEKVGVKNAITRCVVCAQDLAIGWCPAGHTVFVCRRVHQSGHSTPATSG